MTTPMEPSIYAVPSLPLTYHGKEMDLRPVGYVDDARLVRTNLDWRIVEQVTLEPGDGTRYTLILAPLGDGLVLVARLETSGFPDSDVVGAAVLRIDEPVTPSLAAKLARQNWWTATVLAAFLNTVFAPAVQS